MVGASLGTADTSCGATAQAHLRRACVGLRRCARAHLRTETAHPSRLARDERRSVLRRKEYEPCFLLRTVRRTMPDDVTRPIYLGLAGVFFVLAIVGVFLPVLPATPFVLLTSACLVRSSPKLHAKLRASKLFGPTLRDWEEHRAVRREIKWVAAVTMLVAVGATLTFTEHSPSVRIATIVLAAIGLFVILRLKTIESVRDAAAARKPRGTGDATHPPGA